MGRLKDTRTLVGDDNVVLREPITTERQLAKFRLHLQDIIRSVLNAQDPGINAFTDSDKAIVDDAMVKAIYDTNNTGIVDASSTTVVVVRKNSPGTINPGEAVWAIGLRAVELVDNTFATGSCIGIALDTITDSIEGRVMVIGEIAGIDTSGFALGPVWVGPTPGIGTQTPPVAGEKNQIFGWILEVDATDGIILIRPSDIRNTDADFSIYNPAGNVFITATNVQAALDQVEGLISGMKFYQYDEENASTVEAAGVWTTKVELNIANLDPGDYEWQWAAEVNCTATNRMVQVQVLENGAPLNEQEIEPKDSGNWYAISGFRKFTQAAAGPFTLQLQFRRSANPGAAACRNARIRLKSL